jgi:16S rRNA (cytosine967-C5)-methyltransferase
MAYCTEYKFPRLNQNQTHLLLETVAGTAASIIEKKGRIDTALRSTLQKQEWGIHGRTLIVEAVYDLMRSWELLRRFISQEHIAQITGLWALLSGAILEDTKQNKPFLPPDYQEKIREIESLIAVRGATAYYPHWFDERCRHELGAEKWMQIASAQLGQAPIVLRTNTLNITREALIEQLAREGIQAMPSQAVQTALSVPRSAQIFRTQAFSKGYFEMQDTASQMIAPMLKVKSRMHIIDSCAGEGGKTLHLAALLKNTGRIHALDIYPHKLEELRRRARRAGAWNIHTMPVQNAELPAGLQPADAVLIDAPCSGTGVLRRNPDTLLFRGDGYIDQLLHVQDELLQQYSTMVKPGGAMVYATCSILPSEGEQRIQHFLHNHSGWIIEEEKRFCPSEPEGWDGFYAARLRKTQQN